MNIPNEPQTPKTADRRASERRPPPIDPTYVWVSLDRRIQARVLDRSAGGMAIIVEDGEPFEVGFEVRVELNNSRSTATIAYIREFGSEGFRIGLAW